MDSTHQRRFLLVAIGVTFCSTLETLWQVSLSIPPNRRLQAYNENFLSTMLLDTTNQVILRGNKINNHHQVQRQYSNETVPEWWRPCELIHPDNNNNNQSTTVDEPPASYRYDKNVATLLHVGKSAGGTTVERAFSCWRTFLRICHPEPCPKHIATDNTDNNSNNNDNDNNNNHGVIITLRDPIDRFVSSFYWRLIIVCDYTDKRRRNKAAAHDPRRFCSRPLRGERKVMDYYHRDASRLAESLCDETNQTERALAHANLEKMQHVRFNLHDHWLNYAWRSENLFPIVTESNLTDIEHQTDQALQWLYDRHHFESSSDFAQRTRYAKQRRVAGDLVHSSSRHKKKLTVRAEYCLAQYFQKDYEVLRQLERLACKTDDCHRGLQSILRRRSALLETIRSADE